MLEELEIHDLGPIHRALLTPAGGMTAITGETGAGKSMLLSAIRLISGGPASSGRVSPGASEAWAQGVFAVDDRGGVAQEARDAGAVLEDGELYLSRTVPVSGRSRAVLNGKSAPRSVLESLASQLVTIHGQADQLRIAAASRQREFLDMVASDDDLLARYRHSWDALRDLDDRLERLRHQESSARQPCGLISCANPSTSHHRADPQPGEDEELKGRRARIENAADIAQGVSRALAALDASQVDVDADSSSASDLLNQAISSLRDIHVDGDFGELADRLESLNADLSDIVFSLSRELDGEESVEDLDAINARIHELGELTRRWGPTLQDVIAWRDKATFEVEDLDASPEKVAQLQDEREAAFDRALQDAGALSEARRAAAQSLAATVTDELSSLAMAGARLDIRVTDRGEEAVPVSDSAGEASTWPLDANGRDDIEFLFTPFPGSPQLPMGKSASGGELSRLMLALELAAADRRSSAAPAGEGGPMTFIFDEVDAGVGGKAAVELGRRLARLARTSQVIVVTHLAQVASWADAQFVVTKGASDGGQSAVTTTVAEVCGDARAHEIARMLSGSESEASLDHARELLASSSLT